MALTNKEYLNISLSKLNVSEDDIQIIMAKGKINPEADVDTEACDLAVYDRMSVILSGVTQNVTEGGYSIAWNMEAVKMFYRQLCHELGKENVIESVPVITGRSDLW